MSPLEMSAREMTTFGHTFAVVQMSPLGTSAREMDQLNRMTNAMDSLRPYDDDASVSMGVRYTSNTVMLLVVVNERTLTTPR
eukprot:1191976-Prorocentrum_minimum.AAC.1